jgi:hypothetical protein
MVLPYLNDIAILLALYPNKPWNRFMLSENKSVTLDIVRANPNINWFLGYLSKNSNITWDIIKNNPDGWDWYSITAENPNITRQIIKNNPTAPWDKLIISIRTLTSIPESTDESPINIPISKNLEITWDLIKRNPNFRWDWMHLSMHPNITWNIIVNNPEIDWSWMHISQNPNITWDIVKNNLDREWNWMYLTTNPNITWEIIRNNPNYPWSWQSLAENPNITWEIIQNNPAIKWNLISFCINPNLTYKIVNQNINKFDEPIMWNQMSSNSFNNRKYIWNDFLSSNINKVDKLKVMQKYIPSAIGIDKYEIILRICDTTYKNKSNLLQGYNFCNRYPLLDIEKEFIDAPNYIKRNPKLAIKYLEEKLEKELAISIPLSQEFADAKVRFNTNLDTSIQQLSLEKLWLIIDKLGDLYDFNLILPKNEYTKEELVAALSEIINEPNVRNRIENYV